jgi:ankyrin repeat protein
MPLGVAISEDRDKAAMALIAAGADINRRDYRSESPTGYAVDSRRVDLLAVLLKGGADPNAPYMTNHAISAGESLLMRAVQNSAVEVVELLLGSGARVDQTDKYGRTAFWHAGGKATAGEEQRFSSKILKIRELLLKAGAKPDPRDYKGRTRALAEKLDIDYEDEAESEKDLSFTDQSGDSASSDSSSGDSAGGTRQAGRKTPTVDKLKKADKAANQAAQARLYKAIEQGDVGGVRKAVKGGAGLNAYFGPAAGDSRYEYETPLTLSIALNKPTVLRALLNAGADPMVSSSNWPPLHNAARSGSAAMVTALLDKGADPNYGTYQVGETALMHAVISCDTDSVKVLLTRGANPDAKTSEGRDALGFAMDRQTAMIKLLKQASEKRRAKRSG